MIRIFTGKPGGGKSYGALRDIVEELVYGQRVVATNLALDLGKLNAWLQKNHPQADVDIHKRIRQLNEEEARQFWLHRKDNTDIESPTEEEQKKGKFFKVPPETYGMLYVIDEAHIYFDARSWATTGLQLTYYNSQHRKFSDECIFITQFLDLIDKRVKGFAQDYYYFVNNGLERFLTFFRLPEYFTVKVYTSPRKDNGRDFASASSRYTMDFTLADCYDTSSGVGIKGRQMPEQKRVKGLPLVWITVPVVLLGVVMFYVPEVMSYGVMKALDTTTQKASSKALHGGPRPAGSGELAGVPKETRGSDTKPPQADAIPKQPPWVVSFALGKADAIVKLSDGTELTKATGLLRITPDWVFTTDGKRYRIHRGSSPRPPRQRGPGG